MTRQGRIDRAIRRETLTTGDVALLCGVAPRTASKWVDTGALPGYRVPGSQDRRVRRAELVAFMRRQGMPLGDLARLVERRVLLVACVPAVRDALVEAVAALASLLKAS